MGGFLFFEMARAPINNKPERTTIKIIKILNGASDGARTRDPRRDRPIL